jgi:hypothetical protein
MALFGSGASEQEMTIVLRVRSELEAALQKAGKELEGFENRLKSNAATYRSMAAVGTASLAAIGYSVNRLTANYREYEAQQVRLEHVLRTATGASAEQITLLNEQAKALEAVGVVSRDLITTAQGQFATFDLQAESIRRLIPAFLDMVVAEKGVNATTQDMISLANGFGQALQGNFQSLTQRGFVLDDDTKELIKNGTETERITALVKVLNSTYEGLNEAQRDAQSGTVDLRNAKDELARTLGSQLNPAVEQFSGMMAPLVRSLSEWVSANGELTRSITMFGIAISGAVAGVGLLGLALPKVISAARTFFAVLAAHPVLAALAVSIGLITTRLIEFGNEVGSAGRAWQLTVMQMALSFYRFLDKLPFVNLSKQIADLEAEMNALLNESIRPIERQLTTMGSAGAVAFDTVADAAKGATKAVEDTQRVIDSTRRDLESLSNAFLGDDKAAARAFAQQEQKIYGLRERAAAEDDPTRRAALMAEIAREQAALDAARPQFRGGMSDLLDAERTRAGLTDFERTMGDIGARRSDRLMNDAPQIILNIDLSSSVVGDKGIQEMLQRLVADLNRQMTLVSAGV